MPQPDQNASPNAYLHALSLVASEMASVDRVIQARLSSEVALVEQVAQYIIQGGGKRMRPALLQLCAKAVAAHAAGNPSQVDRLIRALPSEAFDQMAAIIEFIHTATLLHDDVVDESGLRRARETANAVFGNAASVLVGDFLYSRSFQMMVEIGSMPVMAVLAEATNVIAEGEVLQLMNCQDPHVDEARYLQVIRYKTAKLFEAAACLPAVAQDCPADLIAAFSAYGRHLGTAFQLTDDVLDYSGSEDALGKRLGDDLREGKPTLPLIYLLREGQPAERDLVRQAIESPETAPLDRIVALVKASPALDYTRKAARDECALGHAAILGVGASVFKTALLDLLDFVLTRES
ncbi:MAG: octaprenyl-diphosphate synthase [Pseudomonadota bacterium]